MTVYVVFENNPDIVERWDNVVQIDKMESGNLLLLCRGKTEGDVILTNVIKCEVMEE